jgi:hypothetical protein
MISSENLGGMMGAPVVGPNDDRFGTVGQVFVDPSTGAPNWVTVKTGLFGRHETFVPLDEATWDREVLRVPYEKDLVKDAPRIDTDEALAPQEEAELYHYYGIGGGAAEESSDQQEATDAAATTGESTRLRKYQVTEEKDVTVPVTHEEVRLEPESSTESDAATDQPMNDEPVNNAPGDSKHKGRHRA